MKTALPRTTNRVCDETRALDGLTLALERVIRWYSSESPDGELAELLRTWEDARSICVAGRGSGPRSDSAGTVLGWFLSAATRELRRGIRRAAGNPPDREPACAWVGGRLAIALPAEAEPDPDKGILIIDPPSPHRA